MKKVSVAVCVYNRADFIEKCLNSLVSQDFNDYEVIVIDDGSTDKTSEILKKYKKKGKVKVYRNEERLGIARSRNMGAEKSDLEIIAFTDSDCMAEKNWLKELVKSFEIDPKIAIVGGAILNGPVKNYWTLANKGVYKIASESGYVERVNTANAAFRRNFLSENRFDEDLRYGAEDTGISARAKKEGHKIYFQSEAKVTHFHPDTFTGAVKQQFFRGAANFHFRLKHGIFPFLSIKSILLLLCAIDIYFILGFGLIVLYQDAKSEEKTLRELIITFPGRFLMALANSVGYYYGLLRTLFFRRERI